MDCWKRMPWYKNMTRALMPRCFKMLGPCQIVWFSQSMLYMVRCPSSRGFHAESARDLTHSGTTERGVMFHVFCIFFAFARLSRPGVVAIDIVPFRAAIPCRSEDFRPSERCKAMLISVFQQPFFAVQSNQPKSYLYPTLLGLLRH